jgi:hypothetical protein
MMGDYVESMPQIPGQYAYGSWNPVTDSGNSFDTVPGAGGLIDPVPDTGSSFELLVVAMAALGAARFAKIWPVFKQGGNQISRREFSPHRLCH